MKNFSNLKIVYTKIIYSEIKLQIWYIPRDQTPNETKGFNQRRNKESKQSRKTGID